MCRVSSFLWKWKCERWIFQANQYYTINRTPKEENTQLASLFIRENSLLWLYAYMEDKRKWPPWSEFCRDLCLIFDPSANKMPPAEWRNVVPLRSVEEYQKEFDVVRLRFHVLKILQYKCL